MLENTKYIEIITRSHSNF